MKIVHIVLGTGDNTNPAESFGIPAILMFFIFKIKEKIEIVNVFEIKGFFIDFNFRADYTVHFKLRADYTVH